MDRRTGYKIGVLIWMALFFLLGLFVWSFQAGELMLVGYLILSVIVYIFYAFLARCPNCGLPVLLRPVRIFGMHIYLWSLIRPENCRHCGAMLL